MNAELKQAMLTMLCVNHLKNNHFHTEGQTVTSMSVANTDA